MAKSYLSNYDPSGFNAGVAAVQAIQEQANQAALQHAREQAQEQAQVNAAKLQLQNEMAIYAYKKQADLKATLDLAHDPATWRQNKIDAWNASAGSVLEHNKVILDHAAKNPTFYDPKSIEQVNAQNQMIGKQKQTISNFDSHNLLPDLPEIPSAIIPSLSAEEQSRQRTKDAKKSQDLSNAEATGKYRTAKANRVSHGLLSPGQQRAWAQTLAHGLGAYNDAVVNGPIYPGEKATLGKFGPVTDEKGEVTYEPTKKDKELLQHYLSTQQEGDFVSPDLDVSKFSKGKYSNSSLGIDPKNENEFKKASIRFAQAAPATHQAALELLQDDPAAQDAYRQMRDYYKGANDIYSYHRMIRHLTQYAPTSPTAKNIVQTLGVASSFANQPVEQDSGEDTDQ